MKYGSLLSVDRWYLLCAAFVLLGLLAVVPE